MSDLILDLQEVSFAYHHSAQILKGITLSLRRGETLVLLGHNGAGKTTLLRLILHFTQGYQGEASLFGKPFSDPQARSRVGYLPENPIVSPLLNAREFLRFFGELSGLQGSELEARIDRLLEKTSMHVYGDQRLGSFSKGMLQRINLARALLNDPDLLILDEPVIGLDPIGQELIRSVVREMKAAGKSVFINTHAVSFARQMGDKVAFMMGGKIVRVVPREEFFHPAPPWHATVSCSRNPAGREHLAEGFAVLAGDGEVVTLLVESQEQRSLLVDRIARDNLDLLSLDSQLDPLEILFQEFSQELTEEERAK